jgi:UDP-glucose 4-epimerase
MIERILLDLADNGSIAQISLRYFNVAGADKDAEIGECHEPETHLIPLAIKSALTGSILKVYGTDFPTTDGTAVRDYIHVEDIVLALIKAVNYSIYMKKKYSVLNLGSGKGVSSLSIIKKLETILKKKIDYSFSAKRIGEPDTLLSSIKKARREIGWLPKKNINQILKDALLWEKYIYNNNSKNS